MSKWNSSKYYRNRGMNFVDWCVKNGHRDLVIDSLNRRNRRRLYNKNWKQKDFPENHINDKRDYYREEYLKSEHWKNLKCSKFNANPCCEECSSKNRLDVHHLVYKNLYDVLLSDLKTLCRKCHKAKHPEVKKEHNSKGNVFRLKQKAFNHHLKPLVIR
jgi:5-methylcytosine-specific restriction endonuclease McrA